MGDTERVRLQIGALAQYSLLSTLFYEENIGKEERKSLRWFTIIGAYMVIAASYDTGFRWAFAQLIVGVLMLLPAAYMLLGPVVILIIGYLKRQFPYTIEFIFEKDSFTYFVDNREVQFKLEDNIPNSRIYSKWIIFRGQNEIFLAFPRKVFPREVLEKVEKNK